MKENWNITTSTWLDLEIKHKDFDRLNYAQSKISPARH